MMNKVPGSVPNNTVKGLKLMSSAGYCMAWYHSDNRRALGG